MITEDTKIIDCDLSIYLKRKLINAKIETVKQLLEIKPSYLVKFRGLGVKSINQILIFTHKNSFYFND